MWLLPIPPPTEYIFYCKRAILFLSSSKILTPHPPLRPASLSSPATKAGVHSPGGEGDGGSIFWKTREIGLPSYNKICTLCPSPLLPPFPTASRLPFSVFLCVASSLRERGGRVWEEPNHTTVRKPGP
jgi:hypothetical protein